MVSKYNDQANAHRQDESQVGDLEGQELVPPENEDYGLVKGCEVANDFAREKLSYSGDALPQWLAKVDKQFGVTGSELKGVCVEQMTSGRGRGSGNGRGRGRGRGAGKTYTAKQSNNKKNEIKELKKQLERANGGSAGIPCMLCVGIKY
eukprot:g2959.t1